MLISPVIIRCEKARLGSMHRPGSRHACRQQSRGRAGAWDRQEWGNPDLPKWHYPKDALPELFARAVLKWRLLRGLIVGIIVPTGLQ